MSVIIQHSNFGTDHDDGHIDLNAAGIARVFAIGNAWNTLLIGFRHHFDYRAVDYSPGPGLWVGVLSNPSPNLANGPLTAACSHFVGWHTPETAGNAWRFNVTGPGQYEGASSNPIDARATKRVGATVTTGATTLPLGRARAYERMPHFVYIGKGAPNYTIASAYPVAPYSGGDCSFVQLRSALITGTLGGAVAYLNGEGRSMNANQDLTIPVNEGVDGALNSVCVAMSGNPTLRLCEILILAT